MFTIEILYPRGENHTSRSVGILNNQTEEEAIEIRDQIIEDFQKTWGPNVVAWIEGID